MIAALYALALLWIAAKAYRLLEPHLGHSPRVAAFIISVLANPMVQSFLHGLVQVLIVIDQFLNVATNPFSRQSWADETLSSRCGRLGHRYPYKFWSAIIDFYFEPFQGPNHCRNAYLKEKTRYHFPPEMRE